MPMHEGVKLIVEGMRSALGGQPLTSMKLEDMRAMTDYSAVASTVSVHDITDTEIPSEHGGIPVRIYRPDDRTDRPVLLWFHGGGYVLGTLAMGDDICRRLSTNAGVVVVNVDYRLAPEHPFPAGLEDCATALEWVQSGTPQTHGFDGSRVAVAGDSAGGNLAIATSLRARDLGRTAPTCQISVCGPGGFQVSNPEYGDLPFLVSEDVLWYENAYFAQPEDANLPYAVPNTAAAVENLPPLLMITAECDATRDSAEAFATRIADAGNDVAINRYDGMFHGFFGMPDMFEEAAQAHTAVEEFVQRHLAPQPL